MKTLFALAFLSCFSVVLGRKCYSCTSSDSLEVCAKNQTEVSCPPGVSSCGTYSFDVSGIDAKQYVKGCFPKEQCSDAGDTVLKLCKEAEKAGAKADCKFSCCDKDLCNGVSAPMVSVILMMACALVIFLH